jgi:anaerobic ribonucleoside-triphosphate reductase
MNTRIKEYQDETGHPFCLTAIPSGDAPHRLAEIDRREHPEIKTSGVKAPYYTNSSCLPVDYTDDLWDALEHQKKIQTLYSGGTLFNIYLDKEIEDVDGCINLTKKIDERFQIPCFAFSPVYHVRNGNRINAEATAHSSTSHEMTEYRRLELEYKDVNTFTKGELEEARLRRPYAVVSVW